MKVWIVLNDCLSGVVGVFDNRENAFSVALGLSNSSEIFEYEVEEFEINTDADLFRVQARRP